MPRQFARLEVAADGEQVLFVVDIDPDSGLERLRAVTPDNLGGLFTHTITWQEPGMAYQCLEAFDEEQVEVTRKMVLRVQWAPVLQ